MYHDILPSVLPPFFHFSPPPTQSQAKLSFVLLLPLLPASSLTTTCDTDLPLVFYSLPTHISPLPRSIPSEPLSNLPRMVIKSRTPPVLSFRLEPRSRHQTRSVLVRPSLRSDLLRRGPESFLFWSWLFVASNLIVSEVKNLSTHNRRKASW